MLRTFASCSPWFVVLGLSVAGCGGGSSGNGFTTTPTNDPTATSASAPLDAQGGQVATQNLTLNVPANAVAQGQTVTFTVATGTEVAQNAFQSAGPSVQLGPAGTTFATPVQVVLKYDPAQIPAGQTPNDLVVLKRNDSTGDVLTLTPTSVDTTNLTLTVSVSSFSTVQAALPAAVSPDLTLISASATGAPLANGNDAVTIVVGVRNTKNEPRPGVTVALNVSGSGNALTPTQSTSDANGDATFTLTSTVAETKVVSATLNGVPATATQQVGFAAPPVPTISFLDAASTTASESGTHAVTLRLSTPAPLTAAASVLVSSTFGTASAADVNSVSTTLTFPVGAADGATQTVSLTLIDDLAIESAETLTLALSNANVALGQATHVVTIPIEERAQLDFTQVSYTSTEGSPAAITVQLALGPGQTLDVDLPVSLTSTNGTAQAGADYVAVSSVLTFSAGSASGAQQTFTFTPSSDTLFEVDETLTIAIVPPTGPAVIGQIGAVPFTIREASSASVGWTGGVSQVESQTSLVLTASLTLSGGATLAQPLTVNAAASSVTATVGSDVLAFNQTLTFPTGSANGATQSANLTLVDDDEVEETEFFVVNLSNPSHGTLGTSQATVTISDEDDLLVAAGSGFVITTTTSDGDAIVALSEEELGMPVGIDGVAYDPNTQTTYLMGSAGDLFRLDAANERRTIGASGVSVCAGLAYDPNAAVLYACTSTGDVFRVSTSDARPTALGSTARSLGGLAFDPGTNTLYASDLQTNELLRLDTSTGAATVIGSTSVALTGLAFDSGSGTLYGVSTTQAYSINAATGAATALGSAFATVTTATGLAYDGNTGSLRLGDQSDATLWQVSTSDGSQVANSARVARILSVSGVAHVASSDTLYAVSRFGLPSVYQLSTTTGAPTLGPPLSGVNVAADLAYDANSATLYLADSGADTLLTLDPSTGVATTIGSFGAGTDVWGLAFDPDTNTLYAYDASAQTLHTVNTSTGALSGAINGSPSGVSDVLGLAYDPASDTLYAQSSSTRTLYVVNTSTGVFSAVGDGLGVGDPLGLCYDTTRGALYGGASSRLPYRVDPASGRGESLGRMAHQSLLAIAYHGDARKVYAIVDVNDPFLAEVDLTSGGFKAIARLGTVSGSVRAMAVRVGNLYLIASGNLYRVNTTTGATTLIGALGLTGVNISGLANSAVSQSLYGVDSTGDQLILIDTATGVGTLGPAITGANSPSGIAYDSQTGKTWISGSSDVFYELNTATGVATQVGSARRNWITTSTDITFVRPETSP